MPKINLSEMTIEALVDLRKRVDETLHKRRADIEQQLAKMDGAVGGARVARRGGETRCQSRALWRNEPVQSEGSHTGHCNSLEAASIENKGFIHDE